MSQRLDNFSPPGSRSVPEWIGKTPDSVPPPRVKLRVLERHNYTCFWSKQPIKPGDKWEADHEIAIILGGENRESNLVPALVNEHKVKTRKDVLEKVKRAKALKNSYGLAKKQSRPIPGNRNSEFKKHMDGSVSRRRSST